jgi:hypothetical protein
MSANCWHDCHDNDPQRGNTAYRRILWIVLAVNAVMFAVEIGAGLAAGSAALQADALDFLGDTANYAISLAVLGLTLRRRAIAALAKAATVGQGGAIEASDCRSYAPRTDPHCRYGSRPRSSASYSAWSWSQR